MRKIENLMCLRRITLFLCTSLLYLRPNAMDAVLIVRSHHPCHAQNRKPSLITQMPASTSRSKSSPSSSSPLSLPSTPFNNRTATDLTGRLPSSSSSAADFPPPSEFPTSGLHRPPLPSSSILKFFDASLHSPASFSTSDVVPIVSTSTTITVHTFPSTSPYYTMSGVLPRRVQPLRQRRLTVKVQDAEVATKGVGDQKLLGKKNVGYKKSKAKKEEVKEREKKKLTFADILHVPLPYYDICYSYGKPIPILLLSSGLLRPHRGMNAFPSGSVSLGGSETGKV